MPSIATGPPAGPKILTAPPRGVATRLALVLGWLALAAVAGPGGLWASGPEQTPEVWLKMIRGGQHAGCLVIALEFSGPFRHGDPVAEAGVLRFRLPGVATELAPVRRYRSFDGWLRIDGQNDGLGITIGLPAGYGPARLERQGSPDRLVVRIYPKSAVDPQRADPSPGRIDVVQPPETARALEAIAEGRQRDRIKARVLSRLGLAARSLALYLNLRDADPDDDQIRCDYVETLIEAGQLETAGAELAALLGRWPDHPRGLRLEAHLFLAEGKPDRAGEVLDRLIALSPLDSGLIAGAAYARLADGDWALALNGLSRALELDPDNREWRRSVHEILREHRPRIDLGFEQYRLQDADARRTTWSGGFRQDWNPALRVEIQGRQIVLDAPEPLPAETVEERVDDLTVQLAYRPGRHWRLHAGADVYRGMGDGAGLRAGAAVMLGGRAWLTGEYIARRPWYDPFAAAPRNGRYAQAGLTLDWPLTSAWTIYGQAARRDYDLLGPDGAAVVDYGRQHTLTTVVSRRLAEGPDLSVNYGFYRSIFDYDDPAYTPVAMITSEAVHSLGVSMSHRLCTYWAVGLDGGLRWDAARSVDSWYLVPQLRFRLGNRIDLEMDYQLSSEAGNATGGRTDTLSIHGRILF